MIEYTVVICTYNREKDLRCTLQDLREANLSSDVEIIVVDNNSTDKTEHVVLDCSPHFRNLKYVFEKKQGLSVARNTGLKAASGNIVIFTDDDVTPHPNWFVSIKQIIVNYQPDLVFGKVLPRWAVEKPNWLTDRYYPTFALLNYGDFDFQVLDSHHEFYGANFAVKKSTLNEIGFSFNEDLGRTKDTLLMGEETELYYSLLKNNKKLFYASESIVYHRIEQERMCKNYVRKWYFDAGVSHAKRLIIHKPQNLLAKRILRFFFETGKDAVKLFMRKLTFFDFFNNVRKHMGMLSEICRNHG